jgi:hypothetical protein
VLIIRTINKQIFIKYIITYPFIYYKENQDTRTDLTFVRNLTNVDTNKEIAQIAIFSYDKGICARGGLWRILQSPN